jgi:NTP pyrophosphatase (non-canonical NTP hydrolase)
MSLTFKEVTEASVRRCQEAWCEIQEWSPNDWGVAMAGECGEACNILKKLRRIDTPCDNPQAKARDNKTRDELKADLADELADTFLYLNLLAYVMGISLEEAIVRKFNKVSEEIGSDERL